MPQLHIRMGCFPMPYTMLPNVFIDHYMTTTNPVFALVYITFYRHCGMGSSDITAKSVAKSLNILESDVINALKYWQLTGLITLRENGEILEIDFLPPTEPDARVQVSPEQKPPPVFLVESRPAYAPEELEMYRNESRDIKNLFATAEHILGKLLTYNDMNVLFGLYDWLRLPIDVIEVLLAYCADNGHKNMRYIEKAALDWAENGITSTDAANEYLKRFNVDYREILKAFGHTGRNPTTSELKYMKRWLNEYVMPLDIILYACDKTVMQIGQPKFSYAEKILAQWHTQGVKTIEDIKNIETKFIAAKSDQADAVKMQKNSKLPARPNRFVNFKQRDWDYQKIEQLEQQYLLDSTLENG